MSISYNGFNSNIVTMLKEDSANIKKTVKLNNNGECVNTADGDDFIGIVVNERENILGVQMSGYVEMNYTGTAPSYNYASLASNGNGGVKVNENAKQYRVIYVDTHKKTVGFIL